MLVDGKSLLLARVGGKDSNQAWQVRHLAVAEKKDGSQMNARCFFLRPILFDLGVKKPPQSILFNFPIRLCDFLLRQCNNPNTFLFLIFFSFMVSSYPMNRVFLLPVSN